MFNGVNRRNTCGLMALASLSLLAGCMTDRLNRDNSYVENFSSIYITQDKNKIVVMGKGYHYIFDAPTGLLEILFSGLRSELVAKFENFALDGNNISGNFSIFLKARNGKYELDQIEQSEKIGMRREGAKGIQFSGKISGARYLIPQNFSENIDAQRLNKEYFVSVRELPSSEMKAARTALSPVTRAADGLLKIAAIPLIPVVLVFAIAGLPVSR